MMPNIPRTRALALMAIATLLTACANVEFGRDFDLTRFQTHIQHGVTTQQQVSTWLGPPASTGTVVDTDGAPFERWMYYYGSGKLPRMQGARMKTLEIRFDANKVVKSYNWVGE